MSTKTKKKNFGFLKFLLIIAGLVICLHIITDGDSTDFISATLVDIFNLEEQADTIPSTSPSGTSATTPSPTPGTIPSAAPSTAPSPTPSTIPSAAPSTAPSKADRLPSVPEELLDHVYLGARASGPCSAFVGDVVVLVAFVNDPVTVWTDAKIAESKQSVEETMARIRQDAATYGVDLDIRAGNLQ